MAAQTSAKKRKPIGANETFWGYIFLLPVILGFIVFTIFCCHVLLLQPDGLRRGDAPQVYWDAELYRPVHQRGLWRGPVHTVYFTIGTVPLGTILAILVAVLLNQKIRGLNLYKTAFFIPVIVSYTSIAMVWQWLYNDDFGLINSGLNSIGLPSVPWLTSSAWAMPSVIIMSIWKSLGLTR